MSNVVDLSSRRLYSFPQIDNVLGLHSGTASRWIDGYERAGRFYDPVVRQERTGDPVATWGEFVECRLLAEFRDAGVSLQRMRPAVLRLREMTGSPYPLASARLWVSSDGRDLVAAVQNDVNLDRALSLVVVASGQSAFAWSDRARKFMDSVRWSTDDQSAQPLQVVPHRDNPGVEIDPRRGYGDPVIAGRNVTTALIRELVSAGEPLEAIAESYELTSAQIEAALRYEFARAS